MNTCGLNNTNKCKYCGSVGTVDAKTGIKMSISLDTSDFDKSIAKINNTIDEAMIKVSKLAVEIERINSVCDVSDDGLSKMIQRIKCIANEYGV